MALRGAFALACAALSSEAHFAGAAAAGARAGSAAGASAGSAGSASGAAAAGAGTGSAAAHTGAAAAGARAVGAGARAGGGGTATKLGLYDYFVDESSPLVFNGALLMFESIVQASPQWAGHWIPAFANCSCYYRVRDQLTGAVLVNITSSCNHAFGAAFVATNDGGLDTLFIFGTPWVRMNEASGGADGAHVRRGVAWGGACSVPSTCSVDAFHSSDPALQAWTFTPAVLTPNATVYNNDVAHVGPPSPARAARAAAAGLPEHEWVMQTEGPRGPLFFVSNASDPTDAAGWTALDPTVFNPDPFSREIGTCPSIRYDPASGFYYVLQGGYQILITRSTSLRLGSWSLGSNDGVMLAPDAADCALAPAPFGGWYTPDAAAAALIAACQGAPEGFGDDSDVDLTEVVLPGGGGVATLLQYGSGNQKTFGFSNLALLPGRMFDALASFFPGEAAAAAAAAAAPAPTSTGPLGPVTGTRRGAKYALAVNVTSVDAPEVPALVTWAGIAEAAKGDWIAVACDEPTGGYYWCA
jgi:hypothetical protein